MMSFPSPEEIASLERAVEETPTSKSARIALLEALCGRREYHADPRRIAQIAWLVEHAPTDCIVPTPFTQLRREEAPEAHDAIASLWRALVADRDVDPRVACGAAFFLYGSFGEEACALLRRVSALHPSDILLLRDLSLMTPDVEERVAVLERAHALDATFPNVHAMLARAAFDAGDLPKATVAAQGMLAQAAHLEREHGEALGWEENGGSLFERAYAHTQSERAAEALVDAHSEYAHLRHSALTVLGLVACREGDVARARECLHASTRVVPGPRIFGYGPKLDLARALSELGEWDEVLAYFRAWEGRIDDEREARAVGEVMARRFPDAF